MKLKIFVCILIGLMLFGSAPKAVGGSGSVVYAFGSALSENQSNYTLFYSVPPVIQAGVKTNITFFVYLTELSGWKTQSQRQVLQVIINTPTKSVTTQQTQNSVALYQGARWGPFNVTLDVNDSQAGLSPGQATSATVFANLVVYEQYDNPNFPFLENDGTTLKLTDVQITATPGSSGLSGDRLFMSLAIGCAVVVALAGVALAARKRGEPRTKSQGLGGASRNVSAEASRHLPPSENPTAVRLGQTGRHHAAGVGSGYPPP
jgi:hypothetical protein